MDEGAWLDRLGMLARQNQRVPRELVPTDVPDDVVRATRVFGSPVRLQIIRTLTSGPLSQQDLIQATGLAYSTFRKNITELVAARVVTILDADTRRTKEPINYRLDEAETRRLGQVLVAWAVGDRQ